MDYCPFEIWFVSGTGGIVASIANGLDDWNHRLITEFGLMFYRWADICAKCNLIFPKIEGL